MRIRKNEIVEYFSCMLLLFGTDTFVVFSNKNQLIKSVVQVIIVIVTMMKMLTFLKRTKQPKSVGVLWIMILSIMCTMIKNSDYSNGNIYKIILLTWGYLYAYQTSAKSAINKIMKTMDVIALYSIICWIASPIIRRYSAFFPTITNTENLEVVSLLLCNINLGGGMRNNGPFWEPGVFAIYLNLALIFSIRYSDRKSWKRQCLYILTIITTFSLSGYIVTMFVVLANMFEKKANKKTVAYFMILMIAVVVAVPTILQSEIGRNMLLRLDPESYEYRFSTMSRISSVTVNMQIAVHNPLGVGANALTNTFNEYCLRKIGYVVSNTNTWMINLAMYGFLFCLLYVVGFLKFLRFCGERPATKIAVFIALFIMLFSEPLTTSILFNTIPFWGWIDKKSQIKPMKG